MSLGDFKDVDDLSNTHKGTRVIECTPGRPGQSQGDLVPGIVPRRRGQVRDLSASSRPQSCQTGYSPLHPGRHSHNAGSLWHTSSALSVPSACGLWVFGGATQPLPAGSPFITACIGGWLIYSTMRLFGNLYGVLLISLVFLLPPYSYPATQICSESTHPATEVIFGISTCKFTIPE